MDTNYKNFISYLDAYSIKYEVNAGAKLVWFGYGIDIGTIEIVVDFEYKRRIGFFSFLNMNVTEERLTDALMLANAFNESLNFGSLIISQTNQLIYKIMISTRDSEVTDDEWGEFIFRLWSISRDVYPLFGRLIFMNEAPQHLFDEFIQMKEEQQAKEKSHTTRANYDSTCDESVTAPHPDPQIPFVVNFRSWFLQN